MEYNVYIERTGWSGWKEDGQTAGTTGKSLKLEAIKIQLLNLNEYSVKYRAHIQGTGWTPWVKNGTQLGNVNSGLRIEAIEVKIVHKSSEQKEESIKRGVDVSTYQRTIDWKSAANDENVEFAMIRAGYRGYGTKGTLMTDEKFKTNIEGALENKIDVRSILFHSSDNRRRSSRRGKLCFKLGKGI